MKTRTACVAVFLALAICSSAGYASDYTYDEPLAEIESYSDDATQTIVSNGYEMTYSLQSGRLLEWLAPDGNIILQYNPEIKSGREALADTQPCPGVDCPPIRLYILKSLKAPDQGLHFPFLNTEMRICMIRESEIHAQYSGAIEGAWYHSTWTITRMSGSYVYLDPRTIGIGIAEPASDGECDFGDDSYTVLTVEGYTAMTLSGATQVWNRLSATVGPQVPEEVNLEYWLRNGLCWTG